MDRKSDRHKTPRNYKSGALKAKEKKLREKRESDVLAKTHTITNFFNVKNQQEDVSIKYY